MPVGAGRDRHCAGLCRSVPVGAGLCRSVPTGAGADRNRGEIARNAVLSILVIIRIEKNELKLVIKFLL